jgi:hypothetical protein
VGCAVGVALGGVDGKAEVVVVAAVVVATTSVAGSCC